MLRENKENGITLVALIITVIVMLILATVSISVLTSDGGLFSKTNLAAAEHKKESLIEAVKTAELHLEIETQLNKTKEKDITSLVDKIKDILNINDKDYIIDIVEEEGKATIVDKETGAVIEIWIDENNKVNMEGSIVEDITDLLKPTIDFRLEPETGTYAENVKIIVTIKEEKHGITKVQFPDNTEKTYSKDKTVVEEYEVTQNGRYKFTAENANGRKTTAYVNVTNTMSAANIVMEVKNADNTTPLVVTNDKVNVVITYDENIKIGGEVLTNENRFQYSIGANNWQTATANPMTVPVSTNGTVYARYFNGVEGFKTVTIEVSNIDKEAPSMFDLSVTATTNSITVSGGTTDKGSAGCVTGNIGIKGYQFQLKDSNGNILTDWTPVQKIVADGGTESYTFTNAEHGITQGQTYKVNMRAIDKAGNITEATNKEQSITTSTVVDSSTKIGISYSTASTTNGNVKVTFTDNSGISGLTLKYQVGSTTGAWTNYTEPVEVTANGSVYARLYETATGQYTNTATATVSNIDKETPNTFNLSVTATTNSIIVSGGTTDKGSTGCATENIGIRGYQFQLKDNNGNILTAWTAEQKTVADGELESYTYTNAAHGIKQGTTYKVSMRAIDKAGNIQEATNKDVSVTTATVADSSTKIGISYSTTNPINGNVKVTFTDNSGISGLTLKYQIGSTTGTWINYTGPVELTANGSVYARLYETATGQYTNTATATVSNIDKNPPVTATISSSNISSSSFKLNAVGGDNESGILKYEFYVNNALRETVTSSETTCSITVTGLSGSTRYDNCYVIVYDKANNSKKSNVISVTTYTVCFVADTKVLTENGLKNIQDIKVGDFVYSKNEKTNEIELKLVTDTFVNYSTEIYDVYINEEVIEATGYHPWYVQGKGYVETKNLKPGDRLIDNNGNITEIKRIVRIPKRDTVKVYNIEVQDNDNYFVGNNSYLVHNYYYS